MSGASVDGGGQCCKIPIDNEENYENEDEDDRAAPGYTSYSSPGAHRPTMTTASSPAFAAIPMGPLNCSYNILLVYRLNEMRHMENLNFALAIACLGYW